MHYHIMSKYLFPNLMYPNGKFLQMGKKSIKFKISLLHEAPFDDYKFPQFYSCLQFSQSINQFSAK